MVLFTPIHRRICQRTENFKLKIGQGYQSQKSSWHFKIENNNSKIEKSGDKIKIAPFIFAQFTKQGIFITRMKV